MEKGKQMNKGWSKKKKVDRWEEKSSEKMDKQ